MSVNGSSVASQARPDVELRLPADGAYVSVLRTTAAGLAARLDFTLDDIEDLRMAMGEASSLVLAEADSGSDLTASFWLSPGLMTVSVTAGASEPSHPEEDSFAWQVLSALADETGVEAVAGRVSVTFAMESTPLGAGL